ncbi:MAG: hypothetical protein CVV51_08875 [Spirochaetae bacterium HGW-Spirochaetae-7]|jgi:rubrerythrin|nr:MAG: hypothetical protein CVV51_08875 [Spirochaetae bacterium HGW-Spirochaetae-7]
MTLKEALEEALDYETRIADLYRVAAADSTAPEAKAFFDFLAADEGRHVAFIEAAIADAGKGLRPDASLVKNSLPSDIPASVAKAKAAFRSSPDGGQLAALENALRAEVETSAFYRRLVASLPESETAAFRKLQEIEDGHTAIVKAELDSVSGSGFWFDIRVFDMED